MAALVLCHCNGWWKFCLWSARWLKAASWSHVKCSQMKTEIQSGDRGKPRDGATSTCHLTETPAGGQLAQCADVIWCLAQSHSGPSGACRGLECIHRLTLAFELCVRGQPLVGLEPLSVSVCVCFYVCQWGGRQMVKFTHHISCPCGSTDSRRTEGDRAEEQGSGFSPFPPSPPSLLPILYMLLSHPPCCPRYPILLSDP